MTEVTRKRRRLAVAAVSIVVAVAALLVVFAPGGSAGEPAMDARAVEERVNRDLDRDLLRRAGIFVSSSGPDRRGGQDCMGMVLHNPTAPNVAWLQARYGESLCIDPRPKETTAATLIGCGTGRGAKVRIPNVRGLQAYAAASRLRSAGFRTSCNHSWERRPDRFDRRNAAIVKGVCQRTARRGGTVYLRVETRLPGGFRVLNETC